MYRTLGTLCLLLAACAASPVASARSDTTHRLVLRLADSDRRVMQSVRRHQPLPGLTLNGQPLTLVHRPDAHTVVVRLPREMTLAEARQMAQALLDDPMVEAAEPDRRVYPAFTPNDTFYPEQWYLFDANSGINADRAWDRGTGSPTVVIAALDSGILPHADLDMTRVLPGYDFISDPATANDGDGRDPDPTDPGDAVAAGECGAGEPAEPSSWHGLAVAGVMVASPDNGLGVAGIDFGARLLPVRVLGKCGGFLSDILAAMRWAAGLPVPGVPLNTTPARVINLSLGGEGACTDREQSAIDEVIGAGAIVVVAAGNEGGDVSLRTPANCRGVITVSAVGRSADLAPYANFGAAVDLSAPGGSGGQGIMTLSNTGSPAPAADALALVLGTSFATAQVSAVSALMLALNDSLDACTVEQTLKATARAFPAGSTCTTARCGTGLLDADAALAASLDPAAAVAACNTGGGGGGGGGCSLVAAGRPDPLWLLLAAVPALRRWRNGLR